MRKTIWSLIATFIIMTGCEKQYLNKIYGDYIITSYTVNEIDSLSLLNDSLDLHVKLYYEDVNYVNRFDIYGPRKDGQFSILICRWELINHSTILNFILAQGSYGTGPFGNNIIPEWHLLNLSKKEIKMSTNYNNKEYVVILNKI